MIDLIETYLAALLTVFNKTLQNTVSVSVAISHVHDDCVSVICY